MFYEYDRNKRALFLINHVFQVNFLYEQRIRIDENEHIHYFHQHESTHYLSTLYISIQKFEVVITRYALILRQPFVENINFIYYLDKLILSFILFCDIYIYLMDTCTCELIRYMFWRINVLARVIWEKSKQLIFSTYIGLDKQLVKPING